MKTETPTPTQLSAAAPALLSALQSCERVFVGWLHDADPDNDLKPGESADRDAAAGMLATVQAAITLATN